MGGRATSSGCLWHLRTGNLIRYLLLSGWGQSPDPWDLRTVAWFWSSSAPCRWIRKLSARPSSLRDSSLLAGGNRVSVGDGKPDESSIWGGGIHLGRRRGYGGCSQSSCRTPQLSCRMMDEDVWRSTESGRRDGVGSTAGRRWEQIQSSTQGIVEQRARLQGGKKKVGSRVSRLRWSGTSQLEKRDRRQSRRCRNNTKRRGMGRRYERLVNERGKNWE